MIDTHEPGVAASAREPDPGDLAAPESNPGDLPSVAIGDARVPAGIVPTRRRDAGALPSTRFERGFVGIERALAWLDDFIARWLPPEANPLAHAGAAANFALSVAIVSGVALLAWYSPSLHFAYSSVSAMGGHTVGGWVRAVHRYSSDLAMLFVLVHAARIFFARKFSGTRWLPWVSGVGLIGLVWFIGWTGYWLIWDQPAQQVAVASMRLLDSLPIFGEPLGRVYVADRMVPSLLFFVVFFLHMLLPLAIGVGLAVHLLRVSRAKLFPNWQMAVALSASLAFASLLFPAPLDAPAQMAVKAPAFTVDAWYLTPLALALRFQHAGLWVALFGTSAVAAAMPWLLGRRRSAAAYQAAVEPSRCHACTQCVQDCPFDAITMVARTDGRVHLRVIAGRSGMGILPMSAECPQTHGRDARATSDPDRAGGGMGVSPMCGEESREEDSIPLHGRDARATSEPQPPATTRRCTPDGRHSPSQALVDPAKCVGCGVCAGSCDSGAISLPWFDTRREEARIAAAIAATRSGGASSWVAFVAGDIDSGLALFAATRWRERLPHYQVHVVPTASWVRSNFIEQLLNRGVGGVLIVRDARAEAAARDGNRWVSARLAGERKPVFRPERAGGSIAWRVVDFDSARPEALQREAAAFRHGGKTGAPAPGRRSPFTVALASGMLALAIAAATIAPSHLPVSNPASSGPEFVFSFKALGERAESGALDPAADAAKPIHMRGRSTDKPQRAAVTVRLTVDGVTAERTYRAKGISHDGPALDEWRHPLTTGDHEIQVEILTGQKSTTQRWSGRVQAKPRHLHVVTFEPESGFRVE